MLHIKKLASKDASKWETMPKKRNISYLLYIFRTDTIKIKDFYA